jgi:ubiquinone/menaquinone biosynthesis C-methylase UbiE
VLSVRPEPGEGDDGREAGGAISGIAGILATRLCTVCPMSETGTSLGAKEAAVEQWSADPCGSDRVDGAPGSAAYAEALLAMRAEYAPWMAESLDYSGAYGLDVLDVGCGQGIDLVNYARAGARATGLDLTPRHVELARAHLTALGHDGTVAHGDAEAMPFADASFDRVSTNGVLHHTPSMDRALAEIARVLRPGGRATVIVYNRHSLHYWVEQVLHEGVMRRKLLQERSMEAVLSSGVEHSSIDARPLVRVYSRRELGRMMSAAGLTGVNVYVRHFLPSDTFVSQALHRRGLLPGKPSLDRLGSVAGWYLVGRALKPG